jgi:Domain of unknown function (DUF932)
MAEFSNFEIPASRSTIPANDENHVTRQEAARLAAVSEGFNFPATILPPGTALYDSGNSKLKSDRARWAKLPAAQSGLKVIKSALAAEDRRDIADVPVADLRLHAENGRLYRQSKNRPDLASGYDSHAFRQLLGMVPGCGAGAAPRGFASALLYLTDAERARIVNDRIGNSGDRTVMLRTKLSHSGARVVRAVLSEKYADVSDLHVAEGIEGALNGSGATVKLDYKPGDSLSQFEMIWPSEVPVKTFRVGDVHYGFVAITNSETGQGSLRIRPGLMRVACANLTLAAGEGVEVTLRHSGNPERVRTAMRAAIAQAAAQIEPLAMAIQQSAQERIGDLTSKGPGEILAALAKKFGVHETRAAEWTKVYEAKYSMSPTTWGLTSAITEAAQQQDWWVTQQEEEEVAAKVIHLGLRQTLEAPRETVAVRR